MPHPGVHLTIVQLLASSAPPGDEAIAKLFGWGRADWSDDHAADVLRNRYACFGAIGPDLLYFLLLEQDGLELLQDAAIRYMAQLHELTGIDKLGQRISNAISEAVEAIPCVGDGLSVASLGIHDFFQHLRLGLGIISNAIGNGFCAAGFNAFQPLGSPRQDDLPREQWYWADYLHYVRSGRFAQCLLDLALCDPKYRDHPELAAYAGGYFTHYVADAIGHPYVNQIVGGPYRLHRQRHTLVENFMDAVVWNRHYARGPLGGTENNPATGEPWLDRLKTGPLPPDERPGAYHLAGVHRLIEVAGPLGAEGLSDALDDFLSSINDKVEDGAEELFSLEHIELADEERFDRWRQFMLEALRTTYGDDHPRRLTLNDGFVRAADLNAAYVICFAYLKSATHSSIEEPEFPDTSGMEEALAKLLDRLKEKVGAAIDELLAPFTIGEGDFDLDSLWEQLKSFAERIVRAAGHLIDALASFVEDACALEGEIAKFTLLMLTYLGRRALWAAYAALHKLLALRAYSQPFPDHARQRTSLWQHPGGPREGIYPWCEVRDGEEVAQSEWWNDLDPAIHPRNLGALPEEPTIARVGSLDFAPGDQLEQLLNAPIPPNSRSLFTPLPTLDFANGNRPEPANFTPNFGGIVSNCREGLRQILTNAALEGATTCFPGPDFALPDYNLDGDRGAGWRSWDRPEPLAASSMRQPPFPVVALS